MGTTFWWVYMANANATAMCSMLDPDVAREMLKGRPDVVCAGQFVSRGKARRADGGFEVHGRFQFGSGIAKPRFAASRFSSGTRPR